MLIVSCVTVSKVVTALEFASKARCATIRSENSCEMLTLEGFGFAPFNRATPAVPATPIDAPPEVVVGLINRPIPRWALLCGGS